MGDRLAWCVGLVASSLALLVAQPAHAQPSLGKGNAAHCIKLDPPGEGRAITNTCNHHVKITWCLASSKRPKYQCGTNKKRWYAWGTVLRPGQKKTNMFSIPWRGQIHIAACKGKYRAIKGHDGKGGITCDGAASASALPLKADCTAANRKAVAKDALPYAMIADRIYRCPSSRKHCRFYGWERTRTWDSLWKDTGRPLPAGWLKSGKGFNAALFEKNGQAVLVFEGTWPFSPADWKANIRNWSGLPSQQYDMARALAAAVSRRYKNLVITGHSLGGGLAREAALASGAKAVTFNAATPARDAAAGAGAGQISNIVVKGEALANLRGIGLMGKHAGATCAIEPICTTRNSPKHGPSKSCPSEVTLHGMKHTIRALRRAAR